MSLEELGHALDGAEGEAAACETGLSAIYKAVDARKLKDAVAKLNGEVEQIALKVDGVAVEDEETKAARKALASRAEALSERVLDLMATSLPAAKAEVVESWRLRGNAEFGAQHYEEAAALYSEALEVDDSDARLWTNRGLCQQALENWPAAAADAKRATRLDVNCVKARTHLVRSLVEAGDLKAAAAAAEGAPEAMRTKPTLLALRREKIPEAAKQAANAHFAQQQYAEALELYTIAVTLSDGEEHVYLSNRSACFQALRRWADAASDARCVVQLAPTFAKGHLHLARSLIQLERFLEAQQAIQAGLTALSLEEGEENTKNAAAMTQLLALKADVERRVAQKSSDGGAVNSASAALRSKAADLYKTGSYREALALYTRALASGTAERDALYGNRAACWLMLAEPERALKDCADGEAVARTALAAAAEDIGDGERHRLDASIAKLTARKVTALTRLGRLEDLVRVHEAAGSAPAVVDKARALVTQRQAADAALANKEFSRARRSYERLREPGGVTDDASLKTRLARCLVEVRDFDGASREAQQAIATKRLQGAALGDAYLVRADALTALGDRDRAAQHVSAALQLDPDNEGVKNKLRRLRKGTADAAKVKEAIDGAVAEARLEDALRFATDGIAIDPGDTRLLAVMHSRRAKVYELMALAKKQQQASSSSSSRTGDSTSRGDAQQDEAPDEGPSIPALWRRVIQDASTALYHNTELKAAYLLKATGQQKLQDFAAADATLREAHEAFEDDRDLVAKIKDNARLLKKAQRPDLYKILGDHLDEDSTEKEIRAAYKKKAMRWHPDRFAAKSDQERTQAEAEFKKINDAHDFLTDPQRRTLWDKGYDREEVEQHVEMQKQGHSGMGGGGGGHNPFGGMGGMGGGYPFGGAGGGRSPWG